MSALTFHLEELGLITSENNGDIFIVRLILLGEKDRPFLGVLCILIVSMRHGCKEVALSVFQAYCFLIG